MLIAIDPGSASSAFVLWDGRSVLRAEHVHNDRLREILKQTLDKHPVEVAIEMIASYGMAVGADVFATCVEIGRMVEVVSSHDYEPIMVFRKDVKLNLCRSVRANDSNIRQALIDKYGVVGTKKSPGPLYGVSSHLWAALAVADTAWPIAEKRWADCSEDPARDGLVGKDGRP